MHLASLLIQWLSSAAALWLTAMIVPGFRLRGFSSALVAALVVGTANILIRPILLFLALPFNILTLGLFTFVVNAVILKLSAALLRDFEITSWISAILGAVVLALVSTLLSYLLY